MNVQLLISIKFNKLLQIKDQGLNPNERDFDGATPLHYAASQGHKDIVQWLMKEGGARIILDNLGGSPLHNAAELNQNQVRKYLRGWWWAQDFCLLSRLIESVLWGGREDWGICIRGDAVWIGLGLICIHCKGKVKP